MKKKDELNTIKDLVANPGANTFHLAFGVEDARGEEIVRKISDLLLVVHTMKVWSPMEVFKALAKQDITKNPREVAFVCFLIGSHCGENLSFQTTIQDALYGLTLMGKGFGGGNRGGQPTTEA